MGDLNVVLLTVPLAKLGDKTQVTALVRATRENDRPLKDIAATAALLLPTVLAVLQASPLQLTSGPVVIAPGTWSISDHIRPS